MEKVGICVVGVGTMGLSVCLRLVSSGYYVSAYNRRFDRESVRTAQASGVGVTNDLSLLLRSEVNRYFIVTLGQDVSLERTLFRQELIPYWKQKTLIISTYMSPEIMNCVVELGCKYCRKMTLIAFLSDHTNVLRGNAPLLLWSTTSTVPKIIRSLGEGFTVEKSESVYAVGNVLSMMKSVLMSTYAWCCGCVMRNGLRVSDFFHEAEKSLLTSDPVGVYLHHVIHRPFSVPIRVVFDDFKWFSHISSQLGLNGLFFDDISEFLENVLNISEKNQDWFECFVNGLNEEPGLELYSQREQRAYLSALDDVRTGNTFGIPLLVLYYVSMISLSAVHHVISLFIPHMPFVEAKNLILNELDFTRRPVDIFRFHWDLRWNGRFFLEPLVLLPTFLEQTKCCISWWEFIKSFRELFPYEKMSLVLKGLGEEYEGFPFLDEAVLFNKISPPINCEERNEAFSGTSSHINSSRALFCQFSGMDFVMGKREGCFVSDIDDSRTLFDLYCNGGVFNLGHRNKELKETLEEALNDVDIGNHFLVSAEREKLAKRLVSLFPESLDHVMFASSGSEAVEVALKLSLGYTRRKKIVSMIGSFHGTSGMGLHAGSDRFSHPFNVRSDPYIYRKVRMWDFEAIRNEVMSGEVAAVIVECISLASGMILPPDDFYLLLSELCKEFSVQLIIDEVHTGWGRTGKLWGFEHFGIVPDAVVVGKGMTGGLYPMAACVFASHLEGCLLPDPYSHLSTFGGSEVGCRVVMKHIDLITEDGFLDGVRRKGEMMKKCLLELKECSDGFVRDVRMLGMCGAIGFPNPTVGRFVSNTCLRNGILAVFCESDSSYIHFFPPLVITLDEISFLMNKLSLSIRDGVRLVQFSGGIPSTLPHCTLVRCGLSLKLEKVYMRQHRSVSNGGYCCTSVNLSSFDDPDLTLLHEWNTGREFLLEKGTNRFLVKEYRLSSAEILKDCEKELDKYRKQLTSSSIVCLDTWIQSVEQNYVIVQPCLDDAMLIESILLEKPREILKSMMRRCISCVRRCEENNIRIDGRFSSWGGGEPSVSLVLVNCFPQVFVSRSSRVVPIMKRIEKRIASFFDGKSSFFEQTVKSMIDEFLMNEDIHFLYPLFLEVLEEVGIDVPSGGKMQHAVARLSTSFSEFLRSVLKR